jgi:hypothetical protein
VNHRGGWALIKNTWQSWIQHRGFFFPAGIWLDAAPAGVPVHLVGSGWGGHHRRDDPGIVGGLLPGTDPGQPAHLFHDQLDGGDNIRYGQFSRWLLQPMSPIYHGISQEIAGKVVFMLFSVPITALLALIIRPQFNLSWGQALEFLPAILLAMGVALLLGLLAGFAGLLGYPGRFTAGPAGLADLPVGRSPGAHSPCCHRGCKP